MKEALVAGVLQQAPDEISHAGDEVADGAVAAYAMAAAGQRLLKAIAEAAQHLKLEVGIGSCGRPVGRDPVCERAQVVAGDRRADVRARRDQPHGQRLEVAVALGLDVEDGNAPAVLAASTTSWSQ